MHSRKKHAFHQRLLQWYRLSGRRDLPWRHTTDPYAIYLSEVMLQQTQVKTVLERYYFPFLKRFPDLQTLADAPAQEVLKLWEGLGYYSRALNLHKAAQTCAPRLPDSYDGLIALPGIGQNTAHAILAFAYHQPVAILEANVKRVMHRIFALEAPTPAMLWARAAELLDTQHPYDYNQAMMDLGAMICTPKQPDCTQCPANSICLGKDAPHSYPAKTAAKFIPTRYKRIVVLQDLAGRYFIMPREARFLNGLYGFIEQERGLEVVEWQGECYPLGKHNYLGHITQSYSHFTLDAHVHLVMIAQHHNSDGWQSFAEIATLPLSRADSKVLNLLLDRLGLGQE